MQDERPGRSRLVVVVGVAHDGSAAREINTLRLALIHAPGQRAKADAVSRSLERDSIDPAAGADGVAVARFEIGARDPEAHDGVRVHALTPPVSSAILPPGALSPCNEAGLGA